MLAHLSRNLGFGGDGLDRVAHANVLNHVDPLATIDLSVAVLIESSGRMQVRLRQLVALAALAIMAAWLLAAVQATHCPITHLVEQFEEKDHALVLSKWWHRRIQRTHQLDADRHHLARLEGVRAILINGIKRGHARRDELCGVIGMVVGVGVAVGW